ncbi:MAG: DUF3500 domain-containing protein [Bacteroidota bacterium]
MQRILLLICLYFFLVATSKAQQAVTAVNQFINTLTKEQKEETIFPFDIEERYNFHFVPKERKGITFNEMNEEQKKAALTLMKTCLSDVAFQKTQEIMQLDLVLKELEKRKPEDHFRDPGNYHISVFGIPSPTTIWGWRFEGHHISFNFSMDKQKVVGGTPGFLGSNPAIVLDGPKKGTQVLKEETESGFALLHSLSQQQLKIAVTDTAAPKDIITFNNRKAILDGASGIGYADLDPSQKQKMLQLIDVYVHRFTKLFADDMLKEIQQAGLDKIHFAWEGQMQPGVGNPHYYRVQGPTFIIEYDNTQNNANHVHSVLRDLKHDFGGDELLDHYKTAHTN